MSELDPVVQVWLDGDDSVKEQIANLRAALDQLQADGLIRGYTVEESE